MIAMLANIVDCRTNPHDTLVDVVLEPSFHDNAIAGATHHPATRDAPSTERFRVTVGEAILWAQAQSGGPYTLFLHTQNQPRRVS